MKYCYAAALFSAFVPTAIAHSWVEQLMLIAPNGTMIGAPGFPRGNIKRGSPGFSDTELVNLIPPNPRAANDIRSTDPICRASQSTQVQTNGSPRLQAAAGANVAVRYQENGHVTLPATQAGKPDNRGTIYIYGTTDSKPDDSLLSIHRVWTPDGQGGDKRGVLLSTRDYDDGQCYQVNGGAISTQRQAEFKHAGNALSGADVWCQNDIRIPSTAASGKPYTLYWVWDWPTLPGTPGFPEGKQEIYTTCMDIDVTTGGSDNSGKATAASKAANIGAAANFVKGQDVANAAIAAQLANIANPTAVVGKFIPFSGQNVPVSPGASQSSQAATSGAPTGPTPTGSPFASTAATQNTPVGTSGPPPGQARPSASANNGNGNQPSGFRTRTRTRPAVSPVPPPSQTPSPSQPSGNAVAAPQNTGTAISNANAAVTTPIAAGNIVTQVETLVSTVIETKFQTVYAAPSATAIKSATRQQKRAEITDLPVIHLVPRDPVSCSKTENAYRLKARNAFVVFDGLYDC